MAGRREAAVKQVALDTPPDGWPAYIAALRARYGWSAERLAQTIGCSRESVEQWQKAKAVPIPIFRRVLLELGRP